MRDTHQNIGMFPTFLYNDLESVLPCTTMTRMIVKTLLFSVDHTIDLIPYPSQQTMILFLVLVLSLSGGLDVPTVASLGSGV